MHRHALAEILAGLRILGACGGRLNIGGDFQVADDMKISDTNFDAP